MRFIVTGLLLLIIPTFAFAQVTGEVQSIGFDGAFRNNCWTPMKVRIVPEGTEPAEYVIAVYQHDLDGDRPIYTRPIVLNGSSGSGKGTEQRFWTYFLPQPIQKGLPDAGNVNSNSGSMHALQRDLQVFLCKPGNPPKPIAQLPLTSTVQSVDPYRDNYNGKPRSSKLILAISASGAKPTINERDSYNRALGAMEDVQVISLRMDELPEDPIGYEAVDAVIWLDGNPADMQGGNLDSYAALKDYIRFGGQLVICQSAANWQEEQAFGDLLPVDITGISTKSNFEPLMSMAKPRGEKDPFHPDDPGQSWLPSTGPYQMARSTARPGAIIDKWIDWKQDGTFTDTTPYLARRSFGSGQVIWVAQSLTSTLAPGNPTSWPYIWDQVMGWTNNSYVMPPDKSEDDFRIKDRVKTFAPAGPDDLGYAFTKGLDLSSKANWLILLAVFFFVAYWVVAGPGSYLYLATKKRQAKSWFFFGITALGATALTVLVVKLVLRGPPEVRHISFVRLAAGQPAFVHTRFGLYIPRDGSQKLALTDTSPTSVSYLSPFAEHPQQLGGDAAEFPSPTDYYVPIRDLKTEPMPDLTVDYRSSSKKFQARWVGDWANRIIGQVKLNPQDHSLHLAGTLTNASGIDLSDIFIAFNADDKIDYMIYVPDWPKGASYDIAKDFAKPDLAGKDGVRVAAPGEKKIICDFIDNPSQKGHGWAELWYSHFHLRGGGDDPNIDDGNMNYVYPLLSVLDRVPAMPNVKTTSANYRTEWSDERVEFYNRGVRTLNASASIAAGQLVILASAHGAVPIPLTVDDSKIQGEGTVFYQFILPIDRGKVEMPTTKPLVAK